MSWERGFDTAAGVTQVEHKREDKPVVAVKPFELVRLAFELSTDQAEFANDNCTHSAVGGRESTLGPTNDLARLLSGGKDLAPLFRIVDLVPAEATPSKVPTLRVPEFNLAVEATAPTGWILRGQSEATIGDLVAFAAQLQTGNYNTHDVIYAGFVPIPRLARSTLAALLQAPHEPEPADVRPSVVAASKLNTGKPLSFRSVDHVHRVLGLSPLQPVYSPTDGAGGNVAAAAALRSLSAGTTVPTCNIVVGGHEISANQWKLSSKERWNSDDCGGTVYRSVTETLESTPQLWQPNTALFRPSLDPRASRSAEFDDSNNKKNPVAPVNGLYRCASGPTTLLSPECSESTLLRVLGFSGDFCRSSVNSVVGKTVLRLFEANSHLRSSSSTRSHPSYYGSSRSTNPAKRQLTSSLSETSHPSRTHPSRRAHTDFEALSPLALRSSTPSLWDVVRSMGRKPIIAVSGPISHSTVSPLLDLESCRQFFETRHFGMSANQPHGVDPTGNNSSDFTWTVSLPLRSSSALDSASATATLTPVKVSVVSLSKAYRFSKKDWQCLAAVIPAGPIWQFDNWPFSSITNLFHYAVGFFFAFEAEPLPELVKRHPINVFRLKRTTRHCDSIVWEELVESLRRKLLAPRDFKLLDRNILYNVYGAG